MAIIRRSFRLFVLAGAMVIAASALVVAPVMAQSAQAGGVLGVSHHNTPLIVVRFNQRAVSYKQPLYNVVSRAVQAKPNVLFNVVSVVPVAGNAQSDSQLEDNARFNTETLMNEMMRMGVPAQNLSLTYQVSAAVESNEVHVFMQ